MTFNKAPWAVDGARTNGAIARTATYATGGGQSGIVKPGDLRVLALSTPGNGLRVTSGNAMVLNRYLGPSPDQAYVASNPSIHTVLSADMPAAVPQQRYYLVCVVIGDPEFNQDGHPFMPSTPLSPEAAIDFEYVRVVIVPCNAGTTRFDQLNLSYPGYALARLEVPPNTTTIQQSMIVDLRRLSQARSERVIRMSVPAYASLQGADWINLSQFAPTIEVPVWANRVDIVATMSGLLVVGDIVGEMRVIATPAPYGAVVGFDLDSSSTGAQRQSFTALANGDVSASAGGQIQLFFQARRTAETGRIDVAPNAQMLFDVQFSEAAA